MKSKNLLDLITFIHKIDTLTTTSTFLNKCEKTIRVCIKEHRKYVYV